MKIFSDIEILERICQRKLQKMQESGLALGHEIPQKRDVPIVKPSILDYKIISTTNLADMKTKNAESSHLDSKNTASLSLAKTAIAQVSPTKPPPFIIAEIKRASPTAGQISHIYDPVALARIYLEQGAEAISVLCEEEHFKGSVLDLKAIKTAFPHVCILRKDFILDAGEIEISYRFGADMILLIAAVFMRDFARFKCIFDEILHFNLTPLIEVHTMEEFRFISRLKQNLKRAVLGINSRDLRTFGINIMDSIKLRARISMGLNSGVSGDFDGNFSDFSGDLPVIFESGINSSFDAFIAGASGFAGILCGSYLVERLDSKNNWTKKNSGKTWRLEHEEIRDPTRRLLINNKSSLLPVDLESNIINDLKNAFAKGSENTFLYTIAKRFAQKNSGDKNVGKSKALVKICGINDLIFLKESVRMADLLGFILVEKSPRCVDVAFLQEANKVIKNALKDMGCCEYINYSGDINLDDTIQNQSPKVSQDSDSLNGFYTPLRVGVVTQECVDIGLRCVELGLLDCLQLHNAPLESVVDSKNIAHGSQCLDSRDSQNLQNTQDSKNSNFLSTRHLRLPDFKADTPHFSPIYPALSIPFSELRNIRLRGGFMLFDSSGGSGEELDIKEIEAFLQNNSIFKGNLALAGGINAENVTNILDLKPFLIDICSGLESKKGVKCVEKLHKFFMVYERYYVDSKA